jgi:hypothetical protein
VFYSEAAAWDSVRQAAVVAATLVVDGAGI